MIDMRTPHSTVGSDPLTAFGARPTTAMATNSTDYTDHTDYDATASRISGPLREALDVPGEAP